MAIQRMTIQIARGRATFTWPIPQSILVSNQDTEAQIQRFRARCELAIKNGWVGPGIAMSLDQATWERKGRQEIDSFYR